MKNFALFVLGLFFGLLILGGTGYVAYYYYGDAWYQSQKANDPEMELIIAYQAEQMEPLFYNLDSSELPLSVAKTTETFSVDWDALTLKKNAQNCGVDTATLADGYFEQIITAIEGAFQNQYYKYVFTAKADQSETYTLMLVPNATAYKSLEEFKADFNVCDAGGIYPIRMNNDWLMFGTACAGAYVEEPVGITCTEIKDSLKVEFN
ncbi:MAG: hypothetical protein WC897_02585 [Candidatus Gracilibacteria bacterium]